MLHFSCIPPLPPVQSCTDKIRFCIGRGAHVHGREACPNERLRIEAAVVVLARRHRLWEHHACCVGRLPDASQVHSPCDLLNIE